VTHLRPSSLEPPADPSPSIREAVKRHICVWTVRFGHGRFDERSSVAESVYRFGAWRCEVGRMSPVRVDTGDHEVRVGRSTLVRVAVLTVGVVITVLAAGCGGSDDQSPKASATSEPTVAANAELPDGRIAFRRFLDDAQTHGAIFTIDIDGSDEKQLTDPPVGYVDEHPDWSPDGKRIAFER
jgi:hypothetical protein